MIFLVSLRLPVLLVLVASLLAWFSVPIDAKAERESDLILILVKVGGSSITEKGEMETLKPGALKWLARTMAQNMHPAYMAPGVQQEEEEDDDDDDESCSDKERDGLYPKRRQRVAYVLVHGAGSFGHFHAKQFGLKGISLNEDPTSTPDESENDEESTATTSRFQMQGLAQTRRSVQLLNQHVVSALIDEGINAVSIAPGFGPCGTSATDPTGQTLQKLVRTALKAGLIPVLHGDACLHHGTRAAILSGDSIVQMLAGGISPFEEEGSNQQQQQQQQRVIFLTDVAGVYTADPKHDEDAILLPWIAVNQAGVDAQSSNDLSILLLNNVASENRGNFAGASAHAHDVTGGLAAKLQAAIAVVRDTGLNVTIAKFGSNSAQFVLQQQSAEGGGDIEGTILFRRPSESTQAR